MDISNLALQFAKTLYRVYQNRLNEQADIQSASFFVKGFQHEIPELADWSDTDIQSAIAELVECQWIKQDSALGDIQLTKTFVSNMQQFINSCCNV